MALARPPILHPCCASWSSRNCGGDAMQALFQDEMPSCSLKGSLQSSCSNREFKKKNRYCSQQRKLVKEIRLLSSHGITSGVASQSKHSVILAASFEEAPTANGSFCAKPEDQWSDVSAIYERSFKGAVQGANLAQALHEGTRMFQLAIEKQESLTKGSWLVKQWIDFDKNSWIKLLSYQAAVYALLQAAIEIAVRGQGRDRDTHIFVQRSLSRQCAPLVASIREHLSSRDPTAIEWLWSQQLPYAISNFVNLLEKCPCFAAVTSPSWETAINPSKESDVGLLTVAISCSGAALKLGVTALSCPPFSATLREEMGRLMHLLADHVKMDEVYALCCSLELRREFLAYFGSRASTVVCQQDKRDERTFWVNLAHQLLKGAIVREGVCSKVNFHHATEGLQTDLAIFGFFAALGRRTRLFLSRKGISRPPDELASALRYLEGGSVLFYPEFSNLSTYQLFIEVVCEDLEWLAFFPNEEKLTARVDVKEKASQNLGSLERGAMSKTLEVCSSWLKAFMSNDACLALPSGTYASTFLFKSELRVQRCYELLNTQEQIGDMTRVGGGESATSIDKISEENILAKKDGIIDDMGWNPSSRESSGVWVDKKQEERKRIRKESLVTSSEGTKLDGRGFEDVEIEYRLFEKELQSVEKALCKLENLLHETNGSERCTTSRVDLQRIRGLKREVDALEVSLKKKATSKKYGGIWKQEGSFMQQASPRVSGSQAINSNEEFSGSNEPRDFEALQKELMELGLRIRGGITENKLSDNASIMEYEASTSNSLKATEMELEGRSYGAVFSKSIEKLKDASADVWRGTCLLGNDVLVAMGLLRKKLSGQELTERERKVLKRTLTDVASVIPIGFLMLLPVTAVGHAAMLAAIQKYVPALIPSVYGQERLDLFRQLEQVRDMEVEASNTEPEGISSCTASKEDKQLVKSTDKET